MSAENPISPKAIASTGGAGAGAILATFLVWLMGVTLWDKSADSADVAETLAAVPYPVSALIALLISGAAAAVSGWTVADPYRLTTSELAALRSTQPADGAAAGIPTP